VTVSDAPELAGASRDAVKMLPPIERQRRGLSVREASQRGGWSRATTYRLIANGKLKSVRVLGRRLITPEAVDVLLEEGAQ
jgi:excisionase family DNA binding protein